MSTYDICFYGVHKNICCGYSLESPWRGNSNEYPQHMFFMEKKAKVYLNYHQIPSLSVPLLSAQVCMLFR